jgi:hypothetical protein
LHPVLLEALHSLLTAPCTNNSRPTPPHTRNRIVVHTRNRIVRSLIQLVVFDLARNLFNETALIQKQTHQH